MNEEEFIKKEKQKLLFLPWLVSVQYLQRSCEEKTFFSSQKHGTCHWTLSSKFTYFDLMNKKGDF